MAKLKTKAVKKRETSDINHIKEILAIAGGFVTILVTLGGEEITAQLFDDVNISELVFVLLGLLFAMIISYLLASTYQFYKGRNEKITKYDKYFPAILSVFTGIFFIGILPENIEFSGLGVVLQRGVLAGFGSGILLGIVGYSLSAFILKKSKAFAYRSYLKSIASPDNNVNRIKKAEFWLILIIFSLGLSILVQLFTGWFDIILEFVAYSLTGIAEFFNRIINLFSNNISESIAWIYALSTLIATLAISGAIWSIRKLLINIVSAELKEANKNTQAKRKTPSKKK